MTPEQWKSGVLSDFVEQFIVPQRDKPKSFSGSIPWCRIEDFDGKYLSKSKSGKFVTDEQIESMPLRVFPKGTVLVSCSADLGRCAIVKQPLVTNQTFIGLVPKNNLLPEFLYYSMLSKAKKLNSIATGTTIKYLSKKKFQNLAFNAPSMQEQQRIVSILDEAFENIEENTNHIVQKKNGTVELLQELLRSLMSSEQWPVKPLSELSEDFKKNIVDGPFGSNLKREHFTEEGVPVLKIQNVKQFEIKLHKMDYVSEEKSEELKRHSFQKGDIIMTKLGNPLGVSAIVEEPEKGIIVADLVRIRAQKINTKFLCYQLNSPKIKAHINSLQKGTTRPRVRVTIVRDIPIAVPPMEEQQWIVSILDEAFESIQGIEKSFLKALELNEELAQSILQEAFNGNLTKEITA